MTRTAAHPIGGAVARVHSALDEVAEAPVWSRDQAGTAEVLTEISRAEARLVELCSRALAHADVVAVQETDASPSLAYATRSTKRQSFGQVRLAMGLDRYDLEASVLEQAAKALVSYAEVHDARALRIR